PPYLSRLPADRARPGARWRARRGLAARTPALPPRVERAWRLRRRRRARRVGQARRVGGRRRSDGGAARAPLSGGTMNTPREAPVLRCNPDQLRTLFLFEALTAEQLRWLCDRGRIESFEPGYVLREGDP